MKQLVLTESLERLPLAKGSAPMFKPVAEGFQIQYEHPHGCLYQGDSIQWLTSLDTASVDLVFADPPYNIKKADWDTFESQEEYIKWSAALLRCC